MSYAQAGTSRLPFGVVVLRAWARAADADAALVQHRSPLTMEQAKPRITLHSTLQAQMRSVGLDYYFFKLEWMKGTVCSLPRTDPSLQTTAPSQDKPQQFLTVVCFVRHGDTFVQSHSLPGLACGCATQSLQGQPLENVLPTE